MGRHLDTVRRTQETLRKTSSIRYRTGFGFAVGELEDVWSTYSPRLVRAVHSLNRTDKEGNAG
jgi:hypothetical protein